MKAAPQKLIKEDLIHPSLLQTKQSCIVEELALYYKTVKKLPWNKASNLSIFKEHYKELSILGMYKRVRIKATCLLDLDLQEEVTK